MALNGGRNEWYLRPSADHRMGVPDWWTRAPNMTGTTKDEPPGKGKLGHRRGAVWESVEGLAHRHLESLNPKKVCIVFDIDGTLLFNHESYKTTFGAKVNAGVKKLYDKAVQLDIPVYLVTARPDSTENREETLKQLGALGYHKFYGLIMCPPEVRSFTGVASFKEQARQHIVDKIGRVIAQNWGDQWTDHLASASSTLLDELTLKFNKNYEFLESQEPNVMFAGKLPSE
jgi:hypothetical protein